MRNLALREMNNEKGTDNGIYQQMAGCRYKAGRVVQI
jgi:hypothetical protein